MATSCVCPPAKTLENCFWKKNKTRYCPTAWNGLTKLEIRIQEEERKKLRGREQMSEIYCTPKVKRNSKKAKTVSFSLCLCVCVCVEPFFTFSFLGIVSTVRPILLIPDSQPCISHKHTHTLSFSSMLRPYKG